MEIVRIFDERLFAIKLSDTEQNELDRCLDDWNNATWVFQFLKSNRNDLRNRDVFTASEQISEDVAILERQLDELGSNPDAEFDSIFVALDNTEYRPTVLSRRKKRTGLLRIYAIRIDHNCFLVTGGAIKLTQLMQERSHTARELQKLDQAKTLLRRNGISDADSFFEWINDHE